MREKLKALAELQKVDLEIQSLKKSAEVHPKQVVELEKELAAARSAVEAERSRLADVERQKRSLEQNIQDEKDKVKKWEARLAEQRSTREYAALAREIDIAKKANQTMAEELVELGKTLAAAREAAKAKEQEFAARQDQVGGKIAELKARIDESQGQVKELEEKRRKVAGSVDGTLLKRYDTIRKKRMPALVAVIGGTCQGCNMNVPPQLYNTLRSTLGTDVCPSCNRIICASEALEAPAQK
ncbi:MAG TPA: C4-type zinc ribbon domain-containing protein [Myxococcales bacterium]|nr:C4-type zinc ribbon domain-containing protein [Myxococcales bacterium]